MTEEGEDYNVRKDPAFLQWKYGLRQQALENMESDMRVSISRITQWKEYIGVKSLNQLVEKRKSHFDQLHFGPEHEGTAWEERRLHEFLRHLIEQGTSKTTAEKYWVVIHGFYKHNKVPLTDTYPDDLKRRASRSSR